MSRLVFRIIITVVLVVVLSIIGMSFAKLAGGGDARLFGVGMVSGIFLACIHLVLFRTESSPSTGTE